MKRTSNVYQIVDEVEEKEQKLELECVTSGSNGCPKDTKLAIVGFSSFNNAKETADRYDMRVVLLHKRDGWQCFEVKDERLISAPRLVAEDMDYVNEWDESNESELVKEMKDAIKDAEDVESIMRVTEKYKELYDEIQDLDDGEVIFSRQEDYPYVIKWERVEKEPMEWCYDTHHYIVAIL